MDLRVVTMDVPPQDAQQILDAQTDAWGIKVTSAEIKHIDLNGSMVRAIARQAEAMQSRYRQTMTQVAGDRASTAVLPLPMDMPGSLLGGTRIGAFDEAALRRSLALGDA